MMLRLQCPQCRVIVKISADTIAQHPVVRCAHCQGLIPAQQCVLKEKPPASPKRRFVRKQRSNVSSVVPIILGIVFGLAVLCGIGAGVFYLFNRPGTPVSLAKLKTENFEDLSLQELADRSIDILTGMLDIMDRIYTPEDLKKNLTPIREIADYAIRFRAYMEKIPPFKVRMGTPDMLTRLQARVTQLLPRLMALKSRLESNPALMAALQAEFGDQAPELLQTKHLALLDGNVRPGRGRFEAGSFGTPTGPGNSGTPPDRPPDAIDPSVSTGSRASSRDDDDDPTTPPVRNSPTSRNNNNDPDDVDWRKLEGEDFICWLRTAPSHKKQDVLIIMIHEAPSDYRRNLFIATCSIMMEDPDIHQKSDVFKVFRRWVVSTDHKEKFAGLHAETLLKDHASRKDAMRWFGENKVVPAAKEVARYLREEHRFEQSDAAECLIAMGSGAEPAVIPYLSDLAARTRHMAIEVLARIGTKESLSPLRKLQTDSEVAIAAKQAIRLIALRVDKETSKDKDGSKEKKSSK